MTFCPTDPGQVDPGIVDHGRSSNGSDVEDARITMVHEDAVPIMIVGGQ